ncbi:ABC transporter substrate-binding protein [Winogradskyella maritima]|uniref:ABC transporter substrate-binding protein n=1 Tax=Winogradskyella maritima TaxID=1517766 RepID=A0ABV8AH38_9FLAO|nr:ABC transporter substrate-binding protein [Winogradskyella maritima]
MKQLSFLILLLILTSCKNEKTVENVPPFENISEQSELKYATGFSILDHGSHKELTISKPWPNAQKDLKYLLAPSQQLAKMTFPRDAYDVVLVTPLEKLVVTSTTHIPALELLGLENKLVGFPETNYISSEKTRSLIEYGAIKDIGKNESINTEILLSLQPDVVIGFGVEGINKTFETVKKAGIPVIYNGDWVESSPLAKAEWLKFFGVLFDKEKEADSIFNTIETNYNEAKTLASKVKTSPSVLSGAMHKDVWYLPNGTSPEGQLMADANLNYLWKDSSGNGSLALSFESVLDKAKDADLWISPSYYSSYERLESANALYSNFKAFKQKNIYTFSNQTGATGGVLYYELGFARPDLVLKDLIKIGHPELLKDYETTFFKPLND